MSQIKAIHQIMPAFMYGDALGNQAARIRDLLREWGFQSQIYTQYRDQRQPDPGLDYTRYRGGPDNILIFHYAIGSNITPFVRELSDRLVLYYHNVTPPEFVRDYNPWLATLLEKGREELALFKDIPHAIAASEYNRQEMLALGFRDVAVLPYFLYFDELLDSAESEAGREIVRRYADGAVNILFVGRLVPNKRQDDLVRAFNYYQRLVNKRSRLFLVGPETMPGYRLELESMAAALGLRHVHMPGTVGLREGLGGYYRAATVFVSLSEHEGFGVPLLESMAFDVPVLAFNAAGVPFALNRAGVMVNCKRYDVIGELIDLLAHDQMLRQQVIAHQRQRLDELQPARVAQQLQAYIQALCSH